MSRIRFHEMQCGGRSLSGRSPRVGRLTLWAGLAAMTLVLLTRVPVAMSQTPTDFRLDAHRWEHRVLLVVAPSDTSSALATQETRFAGHDDGFRERDLILVTLTGSGAGTLREAPGASPVRITDASVRRLRERFDVPPGAFRVLLVGKDGTEKSRSAEPVTTRAVFDRIDAMPMRQREMRRQNGG